MATIAPFDEQALVHVNTCQLLVDDRYTNEDCNLLNHLKEYPCLYDMKCKHFKNPEAKENALRSIGEAVNMEVDAVSRTIRRLRNKLTEHIRSPTVKPYNEKLIRHMDFLRPHIQKRRYAKKSLDLIERSLQPIQCVSTTIEDSQQVAQLNHLQNSGLRSVQFIQPGMMSTSQEDPQQLQMRTMQILQPSCMLTMKDEVPTQPQQQQPQIQSFRSILQDTPLTTVLEHELLDSLVTFKDLAKSLKPATKNADTAFADFVHAATLKLLKKKNSKDKKRLRSEIMQFFAKIESDSD